MKKIIIFICILAFSNAAIAQKDSLAFNDNGKYIYYKVVTIDKANPDTLYKRSLRFFEAAAAGKDFKITASDVKTTTISGTGFFYIYKPSLAKHPDGQIAYTLKLEIKDAKFRYWLNDFVYKPYYRDRYNNYVPDPGIEAPLEKKSKSIADADLNRYLDQSATFARQLGDKLKKYVSAPTAKRIKLDTTRRVIHIDKTF